MAIRFACPHCGALAHVADEDAGKVASCSRCGNLTTVPRFSSGPTAPIREHSRDVLYIDDQPTRRWGKRLLIGIAIAICCAFVVGLLLPEFRGGRRGGLPDHFLCSYNLTRIALALQQYQSDYGCLPPAYTTDEDGRPMHNWRVFLLPYLNCTYQYEQYDFDQPWDSPANLELLDLMPQDFRCPTLDEPSGYTNYLIIIGDPEQFPQTLFTPDCGLSLADVTDALADTIMIVEATSAVPWTQPGADLHFDRMTFRIDGSPASISSANNQTVAFADASVRSLAEYLSLDAETLRNLIQPADGNPIGRY